MQNRLLGTTTAAAVLLVLSMASAQPTTRPAAGGPPAATAPLMATLPEPGAVAEETVHEATGVRSYWLTNNVRVHYRYMKERPNQAIVSIIAAGGEIEETQANRGVTQAAGIGLVSPATASLDSATIRERARGRRVSVGGRPAPDALMITIAGEAGDLEFGLQQAHLMVTEPIVEEASLRLWREGVREFALLRNAHADPAMSGLIAAALYPPEEVRFAPVTPEQAAAISAEQATAWLRRILATGPMEISIVGDLPLERARELALRYIGSLPKRPRISDTTFAQLRTIRRPEGPRNVIFELDGSSPVAIVRTGFFGADTRELRDVRLLGMASRILSARARVEIGEKRRLVESPTFVSSPAAEYPGYGHFFLAAPVEASRAAELASAVQSLFDDFVASGLTADEVAAVLAGITEALERQTHDPAFWSTRLTTLTYRGTSLDELLKSREAYAGFTNKDVQAAFARYCTPARRYELMVVPKK
jgi:zinc protease